MRRSIQQVIKFFLLLRHSSFRQGLRHGVGAAIEHGPMLADLHLRTIIDVGANKGQFSLLVRSLFPEAKIYAFEPLSTPATTYHRLFAHDPRVKIFQYAAGEKRMSTQIHVSRRMDSSSILAMTSLQEEFFPGTASTHDEKIEIKRLDETISSDDIQSPSLCKLDVQGYESQVLAGCTNIINHFDYIYCEISFLTFYEKQALAADIINIMAKNGFDLVGLREADHDAGGKMVQGDALFARRGRTA